MREFTIRKIFEKEYSFDVEIEFSDDGERRKLSYPYGDGWEEMEKLKSGIIETLAREELNIERRTTLANNKISIEGTIIHKFELETKKSDIKSRGVNNAISTTTNKMVEAKD